MKLFLLMNILVFSFITQAQEDDYEVLDLSKVVAPKAIVKKTIIKKRVKKKKYKTIAKKKRPSKRRTVKRVKKSFKLNIKPIILSDKTVMAPTLSRYKLKKVAIRTSKQAIKFNDLIAQASKVTNTIAKNELLEDEIVTQHAAPVKSDEMVFYSYDQSDSIVKKEKLSLNVRNVIERVKNRPKKKYSYKSDDVIRKIMDDFEESEKTSTKVELINVEVGIGAKGKVQGFSISPAHDPNDHFSDINKGHIIIKENINNDQLYPVEIEAGRDFYVYKTNLKLLKNKRIIQRIPLIRKNSIMNKVNVFTNRAMLLVDSKNLINDDEKFDIDKVFINQDSNYEKMYIDESYKISTKEDARFVFFYGLKEENSILGYDVKGSFASKIIRLENEKIYYDEPSIHQATVKSIEVFEEEILGLRPKRLFLDKSEIKSFDNKKTKVNYMGDNFYEVEFGPTHKNNRNYVEFKHLSDKSIFVGINTNQEVVLPSETYINQVLYDHKIMDSTELNDSCIVQINLKDKFKDIKIGESMENGGLIEYQFLNKNGTYSDELFDITKKIFLKGNVFGVINLKLIRQDDSHEYLRTFCSPGTYLVEQY